MFWRSPNAACWGGIGGAQRIRDVGSATLLRLVAPPEVSAVHRLLAPAVPVLYPVAVTVLFREPMGGESGDGGYRGWEDAMRLKTRRIEWLTRRQVPFAAEATGSVSDR